MISSFQTLIVSVTLREIYLLLIETSQSFQKSEYRKNRPSGQLCSQSSFPDGTKGITVTSHNCSRLPLGMTSVRLRTLPLLSVCSFPSHKLSSSEVSGSFLCTCVIVTMYVNEVALRIKLYS